MSEPTDPRPIQAPIADVGPYWGMVRHAFDPWPSPGATATGAFVPRADVRELDDAYIVEIELPGVKKSDVHVEQAGGRLTVTGERSEKERVGVLRHRTRLVGAFSFDLVLPTAVREDGVDATMAEGVLTIRVPKRDLTQARHVPVN